MNHVSDERDFVAGGVCVCAGAWAPAACELALVYARIVLRQEDVPPHAATAIAARTQAAAA